MVRPIVKKGSSDQVDNRRSMGKQGMEWSLRSLRQIDTNAKYFASKYYSSDSDSGDESEHGADQTAYDIFKGKQKDDKKDLTDRVGGGGVAFSQNIAGNLHAPSSVWAALNAPLRTGVVDGRKVIFELKENVTKKPAAPRSERLQRSHVVINGHRSSFETRVRLWLMKFNVTSLSFIYFASFIAMNVVFGGLFYIQDAKCCGDEEFTFADVFNFAVQSSTTIGYGSFSPDGHWANFLVVILSYIATLMNTLFAGLLFTKFVTPVVNIQFSEVMTICNVNGVPCLSIRLGAPDGHGLNPMTDINVRLTYSYQIPYSDHKGDRKFFRQTEDLHLLSNRQHGMKEGSWTLRHVLDESSPLFGLNFEEHPANKIYVFTLSVDAVQDLTKSSVNVQTEYAVDDIMIGHAFVNLVDHHHHNSKDSDYINSDEHRDTRYAPKQIKDNPQVIVRNFERLSETEPYPVWYPAKAGTYAEDKISFSTARTY
ncbi:Inward rectifier potassium channel [Seminavis robusta]|uniref:Inward rectifier potassium channel n=1 Tax=Seminavis robusta TaxID=568900 RepID=A0A9N8E358_9STRA|nr:Inward rectifier potassium channel [Seminavis robusta]|eukprot:Sro508_g156760.1 Inward rectifier potassium channel (481) ;mRNA; r:30428-31870